MPNIILKDWRGVERTYQNKTSITVNNDKGGTTTFFSPEGKVSITDTQEVNVSQYAAAQIVDANLVPENIAEDVTVLGITGTFKGIVPTGNKEITTTDQVDVKEYAYAQVVDDNLTNLNIRFGKNVLGISGSLQSPSFVVGNGTGAARLWYNKAYPWDDVLPLLHYDDIKKYGYFGLLYYDAHYGLQDVDIFLIAVKVDDNYGIAYISPDKTINVPIYATSSFIYEGEDITIDFSHAGWYGDYYEPPHTILNCDITQDAPDTLFSSVEIAFGDWVKRPTETLRITQNGTYDVTGHAQVIVAVEGGEGGDPVVDGKTLVFDDTTSVDGKTLVLDTDASIDGKTLSFGEVEEDATVDGKYLVTGGSVDGKTAILDGRVEGKTLIL